MPKNCTTTAITNDLTAVQADAYDPLTLRQSNSACLVLNSVALMFPGQVFKIAAFSLSLTKMYHRDEKHRMILPVNTRKSIRVCMAFQLPLPIRWMYL